MPNDKVPESLQDQDEMKRQISNLAVRLYRGEGGAGELARLIAQQAELTAKRRADEARRRADLFA